MFNEDLFKLDTSVVPAAIRYLNSFTPDSAKSNIDQLKNKW